MYIVKGGCHCGNISYVAEFPNELYTFTPRACDCNMCKSHGATYASDKNGKLTINIKNESAVSKYRQGSHIADFLICKNCGNMIGVFYVESGCIYGSTNIRTSNEYGLFKAAKEMHLTEVGDEERIKLWRENWFPYVTIKFEPG
jgi:hypothetical protein